LRASSLRNSATPAASFRGELWRFNPWAISSVLSRIQL
jgi:hypothetical protein